MSDPNEPSDPRRRCRSCRYWYPLAGNQDQGECRRYAPRPTISDSVHMLAGWLVTNSDDWCGEHSPTST